MDELLEEYDKNKVGCHIGQVFMGTFGYADDIVLLVLTKLGWRLCQHFDIIFNATKCKYMVFSGRKCTGNSHITYNDTHIESTEFELHLGHHYVIIIIVNL